MVEKSIHMDDNSVRSFMPVGMLGPQIRRKRRSLITAQGGDQKKITADTKVTNVINDEDFK